MAKEPHSSSYSADVQIVDETGPFLELLARTLPDEFNRAIRHVGFWLRGVIKADMRNAAPGGKPWPDMSLITRGMRRLKGGRQYRRPGGRLAQLVRYKHDKAGMAVHIGWIDKSVAKLAASFQAGGTQQVTRKQRRLYNALRYRGRRLRVGQTITTPPRQAIGPVYEANKREIPERIEKRIQHYLHTANARAGRRIIRRAAAIAGRAAA